MRAHRAALYTLATLALAGSPVHGCAKTIVLTDPPQNKKIALGKAPAPVFKWEHGANLDLSATDPNLEYTITIAKDQGFAGIVFSKKIRGRQDYQMPRGEGWLPSGTSGSAYFWKVEGHLYQDDGETVALPCESVRRFEVEPRPTVAILFKVPESPDGKGLTRVTIEGQEAKTQDFTLTLEFGEIRKLKIESMLDGHAIAVGGSIQVDAVNDSTKYGTVIIDNVRVRTTEAGKKEGSLDEVVKGGVGDYRYKVGQDEVVRMTLGSRVE
jgi:hypothetical protein